MPCLQSLPSQRFWTCPVNVKGLDQGSVAALIEADLFDILRPSLGTANNPQSKFQLHRNMGPIGYGKLQDVVEGRIAALTKFLRQVRLNVDAGMGGDVSLAPLKIRALSGDSHNGGKRPLVIEFSDCRWVLKFADPRPHQLLSAILDALSGGIGIDLRPPVIVASPDHQWYFMPYLEPDRSGDWDAEAFMFALGALTAVAYCLAMVDLHLENLLVFQGKPIIIDPECILYNFPSEDRRNRLISTGMLSRTPNLSALRGGDTSRKDAVQVGLFERADGGIDYVKPAPPFHNRLRNSEGGLVDPLAHRLSLLGGFDTSFEWFMMNKCLVSDILDRFVSDDFRIRFLVRTTRLYTTTIHMLNLPVSCCYADWRTTVFAKLRNASHFPENVSMSVMAAELNDLDARDVPLFWVNAGDSVVRHHTGPKQRLPFRWNAREQAIADIRSLSQCEKYIQGMALSDFLEADLDPPIDVPLHTATSK